METLWKYTCAVVAMLVVGAGMIVITYSVIAALFVAIVMSVFS